MSCVVFPAKTWQIPMDTGSNFEQRPIWRSSVTNAAYQKGLDVGKRLMDGYLNDTLASWQSYELKIHWSFVDHISWKKKHDNLAEGKQSSTQFWGYVPVSSNRAIGNHDFNAIFAAISLHFHRLNTDFPIWVCLKIGYTPNYSHLVGIMIINHWV